MSAKKSKKKSGDAIEEADRGMRRIQLKEFELTNTSAPPPTAEEHRSGRGTSVADRVKRKLGIRIVRRESAGMELEFDLVGLDPSIVNAVRRVLLSEVPSMAIEKVFVYNNTSIIQDEVLAHRLGLIPLRADARKFRWFAGVDKLDNKKLAAAAAEGDPLGTPENCLEFELKVRCRKNPNAPAGSENPDDLYLDNNVYTKHIKWLPRKGQEQLLGSALLAGPVQDDILLAKLRPGHELDIKLYAVKGVGRDHAKFSPVCTAYYRLHPEIILTRDVLDEAAARLQKCFSPGVIDLVDHVGPDKRPRKKAVVKDARYDSCSRNVFRHEDLSDAVVMNKLAEHYIFTVESCGAVASEELVLQALDVLSDKCSTFLNELDIVENAS